MESITRDFLGKTYVDQARENANNHRALALMKKATAKQNHSLSGGGQEGKSSSAQNPPNGSTTLYRVQPTPSSATQGRERLATSSWKGAKPKVSEENVETVDDFKCQLDKDREEWAKNMALRLFKMQGVEGAA
jgi:hypothetical protein